MADQIKVNAGNLVMMKSGDMALVTKVVTAAEYLGGRLSYIEVMYNNGVKDDCSAWRIKEVLSGQAR